MSDSLVTFDVVAADSGAEIFLIDGDFQMVKRGIGRETFSVPAGIYKIKNRSGRATVERMIVVREGMRTINLDPVQISSAMPLRHSTKTHEHHIEAARQAAAKVDVTFGTGGAIVIVASQWSPPPGPDASESAPVPPRAKNPAHGLTLLDATGRVVVDVEHASKLHGTEDPSATLHVALDPGAYRLALTHEDGSRIEQSLIVTQGWQTQIYLLDDHNAGRTFGYADLINASITMRRPDDSFDPDDPGLRTEEIARGALQGSHKILSDEMRAQIMKPDASPMLGLLGAHLLIRKANREAEQQPEGQQDPATAAAARDTVRRIVDALRAQIGTHPDVEAIATYAGNADAAYVFNAPPMLRQAWPLLLNASVQAPDSIPAESLTAQIAERIWGEGPWLMWLAVDANDKVDRAALWHRNALELLIAVGTRNRARALGVEAKTIGATIGLAGKLAAIILPRLKILNRRSRTPFPKLHAALTHVVEQKVEDDLELFASTLTNEQRADLVKRVGVPMSRVTQWLEGHCTVTASAIVLDDDRIRVGERLSISFQRTLRIPDDGQAYPLPPGLGRFPLRRAGDFPAVLPESWRNDFLIPMYRREALWISFEGALWKPNAVKVGVGGIDAISGDRWNEALQDAPQNYIVAPDQPWLDGINSGAETVRQFVAVPIGEGKTVEAQLTGEETVGGIQIAVFEPLPGKFPDTPPKPVAPRGRAMSMMLESSPRMGIGAGGTMRQKIYPDKHGLGTWDMESGVSFTVHLLSAAEFSAITGTEQPSSPVDAAAYTSAGFPWFDLYDEQEADIDASATLSRIRSIRDMEQGDPENSIDVADGQIGRLRKRT